MYLRRIHEGDREAVALFLDQNTMVLRWLVAFIRRLDLLPAEEADAWGLWRDEEGSGREASAGRGPGGKARGKVGAKAGVKVGVKVAANLGERAGAKVGRKGGGKASPPSLVVAHSYPRATMYAAAASGADLGGLGVLCEEEVLPERIIADKALMDRWRDACPSIFERARQALEIDVLAFRPAKVNSAPGTRDAHVEFRGATPDDLGLLDEYQRLLQVELGEEVSTDMETLVAAGLIFAVELDGKVAGTIRSNLSDGRYVHAGGVFVHPCFRGRGVGKALAAGLGAKVLGEQGATVILDVLRRNEAALGAYLSAGYIRVGEGLELRLDESAWDR